MSARARARVPIEFDLPGGGWGGDCSVQQVWDQGSRKAIECLMSGFSFHGQTIHHGARAEVAIIGEPEIQTIVVKKD